VVVFEGKWAKIGVFGEFCTRSGSPQQRAANYHEVGQRESHVQVSGVFL
jgi:hypothetical protein